MAGKNLNPDILNIYIVQIYYDCVISILCKIPYILIIVNLCQCS